jgi:hypothetical protein
MLKLIQKAANSKKNWHKKCISLGMILLFLISLVLKCKIIDFTIDIYNSVFSSEEKET